MSSRERVDYHCHGRQVTVERGPGEQLPHHYLHGHKSRCKWCVNSNVVVV